MRIKKVIAGATAAAAALAGGVALAAPAQAKGLQPKTITDTAVALSGGSKAGVPDNRGADFDIAITALSNTFLNGTSLADVLRGGEWTVVLPNDRAFIRAANELGAGVTTEAEAVHFYVNTVGLDTVQQILLYHVVPGEMPYRELRRAGDVTTVQGSTFEARLFRIQDQLDRSALVLLRDIPASNGKINVISNVILFAAP